MGWVITIYVAIHKVPTRESGVLSCSESWTDIFIVIFHLLYEVMFAVFLTLLLADITWTAGKYFILKSFLPQYR